MSEIRKSGEVLMKAIDLMTQHLKGHDCRECVEKFELVLRAVVHYADTPVEIVRKADDAMKTMTQLFMSICGGK